MPSGRAQGGGLTEGKVSLTVSPPFPPPLAHVCTHHLLCARPCVLLGSPRPRPVLWRLAHGAEGVAGVEGTLILVGAVWEKTRKTIWEILQLWWLSVCTSPVPRNLPMSLKSSLVATAFRAGTPGPEKKPQQVCQNLTLCFYRKKYKLRMLKYNFLRFL